MKGKIKNLWEKIKYASLFMLTVTIYIAIFVGMAWYCVDIGFGAGVFVSGCAIVSGIPIIIGKNIVGNVKQEVENRNLRKEC